MSAEKDVVALAQEAMVRSLEPQTATPPKEESTPCSTNDKECVNRWISAFGDCA